MAIRTDAVARTQNVCGEAVERDQAKIPESGERPCPPADVLIRKMQIFGHRTNPQFNTIEQFGRTESGHLIERSFFVMLDVGQEKGGLCTRSIAEIGGGSRGQGLVWQTIVPDVTEGMTPDPITGDPRIKVKVNITGDVKKFIRLNIDAP